MKKRACFLVVFLFMIFNFSNILNARPPDDELPVLKWADKTGAKKIPKAKKIWNVVSYGAKNDGMTLNSKFVCSTFNIRV
jgi:hypothetical protein